MKEVFPTNSFIVANKIAKNLRELDALADLWNKKTDLLNQTDHGYKKCERMCDSCHNFVLEKTSFLCFATETKFKIRRGRTCNTKNTRIVKHFIHDYNDQHLPIKYLGFLIIDVMNNVDDLSENDIESLLL